MSKPMDPERLRSVGSSLVRNALDAERDDPGAPPERLRRIEAALDGGAQGGAAAAGASRGARLLSSVIGGAVIVAIGVGVARSPTPPSPPKAHEPPAAVAAPTSPPGPPAPGAVPIARPLAEPAAPPTEATRAPAQPSASLPAKAPEKRIQGGSESDEIALVARAQDALHGRPAEALALCREHERTFAAGHFVQEREAIAIEALVSQKRHAEAERRWKAFERAYPTSSHRTHLAALFPPIVQAEPGSVVP